LIVNLNKDQKEVEEEEGYHWAENRCKRRNSEVKVRLWYQMQFGTNYRGYSTVPHLINPFVAAPQAILSHLILKISRLYQQNVALEDRSPKKGEVQKFTSKSQKSGFVQASPDVIW